MKVTWEDPQSGGNRITMSKYAAETRTLRVDPDNGDVYLDGLRELVRQTVHLPDCTVVSVTDDSIEVHHRADGDDEQQDENPVAAELEAIGNAPVPESPRDLLAAIRGLTEHATRLQELADERRRMLATVDAITLDLEQTPPTNGGLWDTERRRIGRELRQVIGYGWGSEADEPTPATGLVARVLEFAAELADSAPTDLDPTRLAARMRGMVGGGW